MKLPTQIIFNEIGGLGEGGGKVLSGPVWRGGGGKVLSGPVWSGLVLCVRNCYFAIIVYQLRMTKKKLIIMYFKGNLFKLVYLTC